MLPRLDVQQDIQSSQTLPDREIQLHQGSFSEFIKLLQDLPSQKTHNHKFMDCPYSAVDIQFQTIDPLHPPLPIKFSATYVLEDSLAKLEQIDRQLLEGDSCLSDIEGLTTHLDSTGQEDWQATPIILERWTDASGQDYLMVADGNNRLYWQLVSHPERKFNVVIISKIDKIYQPVYQPVDLDEIKLVEIAPALHERRKFKGPVNIATYQDNRPDFSVFGSQGSRSTDDEKVAYISARTLVEKSTPISFEKTKLIAQIREGFRGFAPPPVETMISPTVEQGLPEITGFRGVKDLSQTLGVATFNITFPPDHTGIFRALVKTAEEYKKTATRATAIIEPGKNFFPITLPPGQLLNGEFSIHPPILRRLTSQMSDLNIGITELHLASSGNPDAPRVVDWDIYSEAGKYYSVTTLRLSDGKDISIVLNRPQLDEQGKTSSGAVVNITTEWGSQVLVFHHRELIGLSQLEFPRMFQFDKQRLIHLLGDEAVSNVQQTGATTLSSTHAIDNSAINFMFCRLKSSGPGHFNTTERYYQQSTECERPILGDPRWIHRQILGGQISDAITVAAITLDQLRSGDLSCSDRFDDHFVVFEQVFDPFHGPRLIMPRLPLSMYDRFSLLSTDLGKSPDVSFSRLFPAKTICDVDSTSSFVQFPIKNLKDLILSGGLDYISLAHLSILLRRSRIWNLNYMKFYLPPPHHSARF